jgi:hypothetical protein
MRVPRAGSRVRSSASGPALMPGRDCRGRGQRFPSAEGMTAEGRSRRSHRWRGVRISSDERLLRLRPDRPSVTCRIQGLHRLLNLEYPRVGRCEWCGATGTSHGLCRCRDGALQPQSRALARALQSLPHLLRRRSSGRSPRPAPDASSRRTTPAAWSPIGGSWRAAEPIPASSRRLYRRGLDSWMQQQHGPGAPTRRTVEQSPYAGVVIMQAAARLVLPRWRRTSASRRALHDANDRPPGPDPAFVD